MGISLRKIACLVAVLFAGTLVASGADPVPVPDDHTEGLDAVVPRKFREGGSVYAFDENFLLKGFRYSLDEYESTKAKSDTEELQSQQRRIAYCVISAGIFAQDSEELQGLFEKTKRLLGSVAVPAGVMSPISAVVACASVSFKNREGDPVDVDIDHLADTDFDGLLLLAKMQIEARTAKKGGSGKK